MEEDVGVRRKHHVDIEVIAVDADGLGRGGQVIGGRLTLLLRPVLGVRLDVIAQQIEQRHRQVLARGDRAPAADRMHADRDAVLRHQVGVFGAVDSEILHACVGVRDLDLMQISCFGVNGLSCRKSIER